jgi:hypothetical protein
VRIHALPVPHPSASLPRGGRSLELNTAARLPAVLWLCRHFLGLMSTRETLYHIMSGMLGPEVRLIQERNGEVPSRLIAEVGTEAQGAPAWHTP